MRHFCSALLVVLVLTGCSHIPKESTRVAMDQVKVGTGVVRAVTGEVHIQGGRTVPARVGLELAEGETIETAANSTLELFLGKNGPVVRVMPSSKLKMEALRSGTQDGVGVIETRFALLEGEIVFNVTPLTPPSVYEIQTRRELVRVVTGEGHVLADGTVHMIQGEAHLINGKEKMVVTAGQSKGSSAGRPTGRAVLQR